MITIKELIAALSECDPNLPVILSDDGEGNNHSPLAGYFDDCKYLPENTYSGVVYSEDEVEEGFDQYNDPAAVRCVVLYPTN